MSKSSYWGVSDGDCYYPRLDSKKVKILPAGLYGISQSMEGIYFYNDNFEMGDVIKFENEVTDLVLKEISTFWTKKELFERHKFPFKRGILLYGPQGSGKTSTIKLIIQEVISMG